MSRNNSVTGEIVNKADTENKVLIAQSTDDWHSAVFTTKCDITSAVSSMCP